MLGVHEWPLLLLLCCLFTQSSLFYVQLASELLQQAILADRAQWLRDHTLNDRFIVQ